jgi:putative tricarboxylic transport membrane protein
MIQKRDLFASLFGILLGAAVIIGSVRLRLGTPTEPQPGFFPFMAGMILIVLCGLLLIRAFFGRSLGGETLGEIRRPVILILGLFVYSVVIDLLGYVIATMILSGVVLRVLDTKGWWKIAAISVVLSFGTYFLFDRLLDVPLPAGILAGLK